MEMNPKESQHNDAILTFDTIYTTNSIQLLKLSLPLFCRDIQPLLATLIKAKELSYCYELLQHTKMHSFSICDENIDQFLSCAKSYCNKEQLSLFQTLEQLRKTMRILEKMQQLNITLPFDESTDLSQLMFILPQIFQSTEETKQSDMQAETASSANNETETTTESKTESPKEPMKDESKDNTAPGGSMGSSAMTNILSNTLSPHQKEIYEKYIEKFSKI